MNALVDGWGRWRAVRDGPVLGPDRQSTRPGVYVVGDLADAPVLKAALAQGWETGRHLAATLGSGPDDRLDVVVVGAGPAGATCAAALHAAGRRVALLDAHRAFHTVAAFPAGKVLYAEPRGVATPDGWPFDDGPKEGVVARWTDALAARGVRVEADRAVFAIDGASGDFTVRARDGGGAVHAWRARAVVLAIGRRGRPARLGVPGEGRAHVTLDDPAPFAGQRVVVVGGGDTAAEYAAALARAGARTTLLHRGPALRRPKARNRAEVVAVGVDVVADARVTAIDADVHAVVGGAARTFPADAVFAAVGTQPPDLTEFGLRLRSDVAHERRRLVWIAAFAVAVFAFYVLKQHRELPLVEPWLAPVRAALTVRVPGWPTVDGAPRVLDAGFWGTLAYSLTIAGFGAEAMWRYRADPFQVRRYASLITFQAVFLFGIPELVAPALTAAPSAFYSLSVPWPLSIWSLGHGPAAWPWLVAGAAVSFVGIPWFVRRYNESFCSWLCGCGGLAETFGDRWRDRAPRGDGARRAERAGRWVLLAAIPTTLLLLNDAWGLLGYHTWMDQEVRVEATGPVVTPSDADTPGAIRVAAAAVDGDRLVLDLEKREADGWHPTGWTSGIVLGDRIVYAEKVAEGRYALPAPPSGTPLRVQAASSGLSTVSTFARGWYGWMVDFWLASVIGVALYPLLGNRVWCRFFCPLRAYMELLSRWFGRLAIRADDRCISCGACSEVCQMGIDVQGFAQQGLAFDNATSACIQCGLCVTACPMDVLSLGDKPAVVALPGADGPRWG